MILSLCQFPTHLVRRGAFVALLGGLLTPSAAAEDKTRIVGYGSVGYSLLVTTDTPDGEELPFGDTFGGASKKGTFRNLTRFGLNITHETNDTTSILLQLAANGSDLFHGTDEEHQFNVKANLAGLKFKSDLFEVMLGILPTGHFMISDSMYMGATYLWAQPPKIFYRVGDSSNVVGARVRRSFDLDENLLTFELLAGEVDYRKWYDSNTDIDSRSVIIYSFGADLEAGDHNFHFALTTAPEMSFTRTEYTDQVLSPGNPAVRLGVPGGCKNSLLDGLSAGYDGYLTDEFRVQAEFVMRRTHFAGCYGSQAFVEKVRLLEQAGYLAFAYSLGAWTPRLLFLKQSIGAELDDAADHFAAKYPVFQRPIVRATYLQRVGYRVREKTDSFGIGLNRQITPFIVAKGELEYYIAPDKNIHGYQIPHDSTAMLLNVAVDYVF